MFIFPMSGRGNRFLEAGYSVEKYLLEVEGKKILEKAVLSFEKYFQTDKFLFVMRNDDVNEQHVTALIASLGIKDFIVVTIGESEGQADTVQKGLKSLDPIVFDNGLLEEEIYIFNVDSFLLNFKKFEPSAKTIASLDVFRPVGDHFSFVEPHPKLSNIVSNVTEKVKVSDLASTGLYYFKHLRYFFQCMETEADRISSQYGEVFVAPLFNHFIERGQVVTYREIDNEEIVILGTPLEYEKYVK